MAGSYPSARSQALPGNALPRRLCLPDRQWFGRRARRSLADSAFPGRAWEREGVASLALRAGCALILLSCAATATRADEPAPLGVRAVAFSPDGKRLAAGTGEPKEAGIVTVWDVATRKPLWAHGEASGVPAVAFAPDGKTLAVAVYDKAARLLDASTGKVTRTLAHPAEVRGVAFSPDGKRVATSCWDHKLRVWDMGAGTELVTCSGHQDRVFTVDWSADGKYLVSAGGNDGAVLWDAATGAQKRAWKHGMFYVPAAHFTPDGRWVLTAGYDGSVRLWNVETGELRARFSGTGGVNGFAFSPAAGTLALCGYGRSLALFSLTLTEPTAAQREKIEALLRKLDDDSYDVREAAGAELLGLGFVAEAALRRAAKEARSAEVRIRARRLREEMLSKPRATLRGHTGDVDAAAFSPDGKLLASGSKDGTVRLWDVATAKEVARLSPE